jgi:hypothetical protein
MHWSKDAINYLLMTYDERKEKGELSSSENSLR